MGSLDGKTALIVGGGRGLGRSTAIAFAKQGANVVVAARTQAEIDSTAAEVSKLGRQALAVRTDATKEDQVNKLVSTAIEKFGKIDVLVNCQGEALIKPTLETTSADWDRLHDSNLKSVYLTTKAVLPGMVQRKEGHILNVSSKAAIGAGGGTIAIYKAAKLGLIGFSKAIAAEHKPNNIKVNVICPSPIDTPMRWSATPNFDRKKIMAPERVADLMVLLASQGDVYYEELILPNAITN